MCKQMYSFTPSLTSAIDEGGWPTPRPGHFAPGKGHDILRTGGWVGPGPVWTFAVNLAPTRFDPRTL